MTIVVAFAAAWLRFVSLDRRPHVGLNAAVTSLGTLSVLLILFRIVDPPAFYPESTLAAESTVQLPMYLALAAAVGVAGGGLLALGEKREPEPAAS